MEQKRIHRRLEDFVEAEFVSKATDITMIIRTKTRDISAGGIKVYLNHQFAPEEKVDLKMSLPKPKEVICAQVQVISSKLISVITDKGKEHFYETRFRFLKMDAVSKNHIIRYIYNCRKQKQCSNSQ